MAFNSLSSPLTYQRCRLPPGPDKPTARFHSHFPRNASWPRPRPGRTRAEPSDTKGRRPATWTKAVAHAGCGRKDGRAKNPLRPLGRDALGEGNSELAVTQRLCWMFVGLSLRLRTQHGSLRSARSRSSTSTGNGRQIQCEQQEKVAAPANKLLNVESCTARSNIFLTFRGEAL